MNEDCRSHFMPPWVEMPMSFIDWLVARLMKNGYRQVQCPICSVFYFKHPIQIKLDDIKLKEHQAKIRFRAFDPEI